MENFSFSTSRVLFEHPLTLAAQGELYCPVMLHKNKKVFEDGPHFDEVMGSHPQRRRFETRKNVETFGA